MLVIESILTHGYNKFVGASIRKYFLVIHRERLTFITVATAKDTKDAGGE